MGAAVRKSLGQIAYEADGRGGIQNFGPWDKLDGSVGELIKEIHKNMGDAVFKEVRRRFNQDLKNQPKLLK